MHDTKSMVTKQTRSQLAAEQIAHLAGAGAVGEVGERTRMLGAGRSQGGAVGGNACAGEARGISSVMKDLRLSPLFAKIFRASIVCIAISCILPHFDSILTTHCADTHMLALALFQDRWDQMPC